MGIFCKLAIALTVLTVASCKQRGRHSWTKAQPVDRKVLGVGLPYQPEELNSLRVREDKAYQRAQAWRIIAGVIREQSIGQNLDDRAFSPQIRTLPLWQTWYESDEFVWMLSQLHKKTPQGRPFCPEDLESIFSQHAAKKLSFRFNPNRFARRLGKLKTPEQVRGVSGSGVTLFSPATLLHYLTNYDLVARCIAPPPHELPGRHDVFTNCFAAEFPRSSQELYQSFLNRWRQEARRQAFAHCQRGVDAASGPESIGATAAIKSSWQRVKPGAEIALFDHSPTALARHFDRGVWQPDDTVPAADIDPAKIFTISTVPVGSGEEMQQYQLTGFHVITKDTREWLWISLWYSDDPDADFGADRPDCGDHPEPCIPKGPWQNYKMCVVADYQTPSQFLDNITDPGLAASLRIIQEQLGPHSWCSNPYIEQGKGNALTNCVGCHQHAGTDVFADDTFRDDPEDPQRSVLRARFPHHGRSQLRKNFPGEYLWSFSDSPDFFRDKVNKVLQRRREP